MEEKIEKFLTKFEEMVAAANEIDEFKYEFGVSIKSSNLFITERERMISGVNEIFTKNNMRYTSSTRN